MGTYREYIEELKEKYIGKTVRYEGKTHKIVDVDYNGAIHIDRPGRFTETTAVFWPHEADKAIKEEEDRAWEEFKARIAKEYENEKSWKKTIGEQLAGARYQRA